MAPGLADWRQVRESVVLDVDTSIRQQGWPDALVIDLTADAEMTCTVLAVPVPQSGSVSAGADATLDDGFLDRETSSSSIGGPARSPVDASALAAP
jgi:hypothetical protein